MEPVIVLVTLWVLAPRRWRRIVFLWRRFYIKPINWIASRWGTQIHWSFDSEEAIGTVRVTRGAYGVYAAFEELCGPNEDVVLLDLFYRSTCGADSYEERPYAVHIYDQSDFYGDPLTKFIYVQGETNGPYQV